MELIVLESEENHSLWQNFQKYTVQNAFASCLVLEVTVNVLELNDPHALHLRIDSILLVGSSWLAVSGLNPLARE